MKLYSENVLSLVLHYNAPQQFISIEELNNSSRCCSSTHTHTHRNIQIVKDNKGYHLQLMQDEQCRMSNGKWKMKDEAVKLNTFIV